MLTVYCHLHWRTFFCNFILQNTGTYLCAAQKSNRNGLEATYDNAYRTTNTFRLTMPRRSQRRDVTSLCSDSYWIRIVITARTYFYESSDNCYSLNLSMAAIYLMLQMLRSVLLFFSLLNYYKSLFINESGDKWRISILSTK